MSDTTTVSPTVVHSAGEIVYVNEAFLSLVGANSRDSVLGMSVLDLVGAESAERLAEQFVELSTGAASMLGLEIDLVTMAAGETDAVTVSSPVEWDGEEYIRTMVFDVGRQLSTDSLLDRTLEEMPLGVSIADATGDDLSLIYVNDEFTELTGYPREEALGRNCRFLQGEDTRREPIDEMRAAIEAGEPCQVTLRNYRKDGSMFWNRVTLEPVRDDTGSVTHYLGFQEDVSEKKLYEREKTLFEKHAEASEWTVMITDRNGTIEYVNPAFERVTGYTAEEAIGRTPRILNSGEQDDRFYEELWETITSGEVWEADVVNQTKSDELYQAHQTITPITDNRGEITHFVAIEPDITETVFSEQVIDVMDRVFRHNIRTSVNVIDGHADVLLAEIDDPEQRAALRTIKDHAAVLEKASSTTGLIRGIFQERQTPHTLDVTRIPKFIEQARTEYPNAVIDVAMELDDDVEITNGSLLEVAIGEAIENAIEHNDRDTPRVQVTVSMPDETTMARIEIADNGPGVPDAEWAVIEAGEETPLSHGSGIGLWVIYWTATALGGTVDVSANEPRGSVVTFRVPTGPPVSQR